MENFKTLLKWMIWEYHYFRKHPISVRIWKGHTTVFFCSSDPCCFFQSRELGPKSWWMILLHLLASNILGLQPTYKWCILGLQPIDSNHLITSWDIQVWQVSPENLRLVLILKVLKGHGMFRHLWYRWRCFLLRHLEWPRVSSRVDTVDGSEIPNNHLGCIPNPMSTRISTTSTGAGFLPSTVWQKHTQRLLFFWT